MHTIYCWNNLFYYNVQLKLSTFFSTAHPYFVGSPYESLLRMLKNVQACKRLHMAQFRGRDITSFRPADVHLGAYFKYTVDKTPYGGFA